MKKTWQIIREVISKTNNKNSCIDEIKMNGSTYTNNLDISNKFNEYFTSIASDISSQINPSPLDPCDFILDNNFNFRLFTKNPVILIDIVRKMENKDHCLIL